MGAVPTRRTHFLCRVERRVQFPLLRCIWRDSTYGIFIPSCCNSSNAAFEAESGGAVPSEGANLVSISGCRKVTWKPPSLGTRRRNDLAGSNPAILTNLWLRRRNGKASLEEGPQGNAEKSRTGDFTKGPRMSSREVKFLPLHWRFESSCSHQFQASTNDNTRKGARGDNLCFDLRVNGWAAWCGI